MVYDTLLVDISNRIATLTINRPDKLNALNDATISEIGRAVDDAITNGDVGGIVITGAGRAFVAGADISQLASQTPVQARERARQGQAVFRRIEMSPKPIVAAVNGFALGGGCELAMACHVRIASETAQFGQPEVKLGITPGFGGTQRLARLVGRGRALQLLLTGERIDAREAHRIGLVNAVVPSADVVTAAQALLGQMLANAPLAIALCIEAVDRGLDMGMDEGCSLEANHFGLLAATSDMREGMQAFLEKRPAQFRGQ
jgi:enoyl-CoA hydratase